MKKSELPLDLTGVVKKIELPEFKSMAIFTLNWMEIFSRSSKHYENANPHNESKAVGGVLATELWLEVISFLDDKSLMFLIRTCKTFRNIANDGTIRERLYDYDRCAEILSHSRQSFAGFCSSLPSMNAIPLPIITVPYHGVNLFPPAHERRAYNDNSPGSGFTFN